MHFSQPGMIGDLEIKNRIVMAPMISNLCDTSGNSTEQHMAYLEARSLGGAGLIITEYTFINDRNSRGSRNQLGLYSDLQVPKLSRLTERIHRNQSKIFIQLVHAGGKAITGFHGERPEAPSSVPYMGVVPDQMCIDEISSVQEDFLKAALRSRRSGFDGIELHGAHGYLIHEFLSPSLNKRDDRYGGSFDNRKRFAQEIVGTMKNDLDIPVGMRLSVYEDDPEGYDAEYGLKIAESIKGLDFVHLSAGRFSVPGSSASFYTKAPHIALRLPRKPEVTSIVVGSITDLETIETTLKKSDFVSIGRGMLADPYFANKMMNYPDLLRPCIRCNQACRNLSWGEVRCTVNPDTGLETIASRKRCSGDIVLIGGGIKGLEAAMTAARSGLSVTLYEDHDYLGGQINEIADIHKKSEFHKLVNYYDSALKKLNVNVELGTLYKGQGLSCASDISYSHLPRKDTLLIDSVIYQHHDEALALADSCKIVMTERSLSTLDRTRSTEYRKIAESKGITFTERTDMEFDISFHVKKQYDILSAMISGRNTVMDFVEINSNEFL